MTMAKKGDMLYAWTNDADIKKKAELGGAVTAIWKHALDSKAVDAVLDDLARVLEPFGNVGGGAIIRLKQDLRSTAQIQPLAQADIAIDTQRFKYDALRRHESNHRGRKSHHHDDRQPQACPS